MAGGVGEGGCVGAGAVDAEGHELHDEDDVLPHQRTDVQEPLAQSPGRTS